MGAGVIVTVPLLIAVLLFQRRILAGLDHWWREVGSTRSTRSSRRPDRLGGRPPAFAGGFADPRRIHG